MISTEASWWNILNLKINTTLGYIVSQILLNLGHVFRSRIGSLDTVVYILNQINSFPQNVP